MAKKPPRTSVGTDRQAKIDAAAKANQVGPNKILIGAVVVIVAIIAVVAGVIVADQSTKSKAAPKDGGTSVPTAAGEMGAGFVANEDATLVAGAPTLDIYEDFRCPACHQAYGVFHDTVSELANEGKIKLVYHFKTIIDSHGGNESLQAANAAICAADAGKFNEYHDAVLGSIVAANGQQPPWGPEFYTQSAAHVGISGDALTTFNQCVADGSYEGYVRSVEERSARDGINATPQYFLNGELVDFQTVNTGELMAEAIEKATGN
ncbi:MAG TPA: thioredoxin domain-containing protein [Intrasporangiaceae bacterium]|nr:thioredoxin domain-containing protein [Intrasporangiaceae bacterium]